MKRWFWLTAGLLIWAIHFMGVYLISSAADVWSSTDAPASRLTGLAFSAGCLVAVAGAAAGIWRRRGRSVAEAWERRVGMAGTVVAGIGVVWQTAPLAF
jgi:hypothetical protein